MNQEKNIMKIKWRKSLIRLSPLQEKKIKRKRKFKNVDEKIEGFLDPRKTKMVIEFNNYEAASIKSIAVKKM